VDATPDAFLVTECLDPGQSSFEPGELYLFQTVEEISLSNKIFGFLHTRSALARLGINSVGSSYYVAPGYGRGVPSSFVLEVTSVKTVINLPIEDPIAGLVLFESATPFRIGERSTNTFPFSGA
jgi:deoxycytidine triphosphate deaminase